MMGVAISETFAGRMSGSEFRSFQERRPDRERWELVAGVPMMMTPPTIAHNRIASNLERLLNDALDRHDPSRMAVQRPGIELGSGDYRPEPDIGVIDADYDENQRFVVRAYLLAEIVSGSDDVPVPGTQERWIDVKRQIYLAHEPCEALLIVQQGRIEAQFDIRTPNGWKSATISGPSAELNLPPFGLKCRLGELYEGTPLHPRAGRKHRP
jgi:Uma2 family endonuclease